MTHLLDPRDLDDATRAAWGAALDQLAVPTPYLTPEFAALVADVRGGVRVAVVERDGRPAGFFPFQTDPAVPGDDRGEPVGGRLSDFHGLLAPPDFDLDPVALLRACGLSRWRFDHLVGGHPAFEPFVEMTAPSRFLDLSDGFDAYYDARRAAGSRKVKQIARKDRGFERECGPLRFEFDCRDPAVRAAVLDRMIEWKRAQYRATGVFDLFTLGWPRELLTRLGEPRGDRLTGLTSALFAADADGTERVVAVDVGMRCGPVLHSWFAAYDPVFADHSPGHVCTLRLARAAAEAGVTRLELGRGPEPYKRSLASGSSPVGEGVVDVRPLAGPVGRGVRGAWRSAKRVPVAEPLRRNLRRAKNFTRGAAGF